MSAAIGQTYISSPALLYHNTECDDVNPGSEWIHFSHVTTDERVRMRKLITGALVTVVAASGLAVTTALPAVASPCSGNPYWCSGITRVRKFPKAWISMETRLGSDHHEYAYGRGHIPENRWLYLDAKGPDGVHHGWVKKVKGRGTGRFSREVTTASVFDGQGYKVRACTDTAGVYTCTGWH
jgi:hypothetical protein